MTAFILISSGAKDVGLAPARLVPIRACRCAPLDRVQHSYLNRKIKNRVRENRLTDPFRLPFGEKE